MESEEISSILTCPKCHRQIYFQSAHLQGCLKLICKQCNETLLDWDSNKIQKPKISEEEAPTSFLPIPQEIGEYQIIKLLARGTVGEIYLGKHKLKSTYVAIKLLSAQMQNDTKAEERFFREANVHSKLDHPNIVKIEEVGFALEENNKRLYLIMEYIEGESLESILNTRGAIAPRHTFKIAIAVANALEYAWKQKIIHRDLKPGNILIDKKSRKVKVTDLGLGKMLGEKGPTLDGELMGTAYYMPPEQIKNAKEADQRADIYALGATLYHMLAGRPPYSEVKGTLNILRTKMSQDPIPLKEHVPTLSKEICDVVAKAMARDRNLRYDNPTKMIEAMQKILVSLPSS